MTHVRTTLAAARLRTRALVARCSAWWHGLEPPERIWYRAVALLAVGLAGYDWRLALTVPGTLYALVFFGFSLRRGSD